MPNADRLRGKSADEIVEDRQIVRRQVPDDVHVVLKHAEVDAHAVDEVEVADLAGLDDLFDLLDGAAVDVGVVDHQDAAGFAGGGDQLLGFVDRCGQRLFDEHVFAGAERANAHRGVRVDRRGDGDGVDVGSGEELVEIMDGVNGRKSAQNLGQDVADLDRKRRLARVAGQAAKLRIKLGPQYPAPTTATRIMSIPFRVRHLGGALAGFV